MSIKDWIGETTEYDKKLALEVKKPKSWCKSVSAFANTLGGALIFGISNSEEIVGLEDPNEDAEKISEIIKTRLDPIPEFRLRFEQIDKGKVISFWIFLRAKRHHIIILVMVCWKHMSVLEMKV